MSSHKKRTIVIAPGRGTYTRQELQYFDRFQSSDARMFLKMVEEKRREDKWPGIFELDKAERFSPSFHMAGEHASSLIYACAYADFIENLPSDSEVVGVIGNSMGWYISLVCAGVLSPESGYHLIQTMGSMMQDKIIGGQVIYPVVNDAWQYDAARHQHVMQVLSELKSSGEDVGVSIYLGGYLVLAGSDSGIHALQKALDPVDDRFPMRLNYHAAFHTPLMISASERGQALISATDFQAPAVPLIDGQGKIWHPQTTNVQAIYDYTLKNQVLEPYDFTASLEVALKEFNPDQLVLLGPGGTLGGAIGQTLVKNRWFGMECKEDFIKQQSEKGFLISLGS